MATLNSSYQYIARSNAVPCAGGWNYYILLYAKAVENATTGKHTVSVKMRLVCSAASTFYGWSTSGDATVNGESAFSWSRQQIPGAAWNTTSITEGSYTYPRWIDLKEGSVVVNTGYGTTKEITITGSWVMKESNSANWFPSTGTYANASAKVTLPMIAGATAIDSVTCATKYLDGTLTYKYTPLSASMYNRCNISHNLNGEYIAVRSINLGKKSASQQTDSVTLTESELEKIYEDIPNTSDAVIRFTFRTYSDSDYSTQVGSADYEEITLSVPKNDKTLPDPGMKLSPVSSLPAAFDGLYIQGRSKVDADFEGSGKYGADIKSYSMSVEGKSYSSPYTSEYLTHTGSVTVSGTATDSRDYPGKEDQTITVIPYTGPKISVGVCGRCDADGNLSDSGTYLKITASRSYSKVVSEGVQKNFCKIRFRYKLVSAASWSAWTTILSGSASGDTVTTGALLGGALSSQSTYQVQVQAIDDIGDSSTSTFSIPTDKVHMHRTKNAMGLGKYVEGENLLDVGWDAHFHGEVLIGETGMTLKEYILSVISEGG